MADDYTTLVLVKDALEITDSSQDTLITAKITAASRSVDNFCGRRFWLDDTAAARVINPARRTVRTSDGERLLIDDIGSLDDLKVEIGVDPNWADITQEVETEPTDAMDLDPAQPVTSLLRPLRRWQEQRLGRVRITAKWGWPAVPEVVKEATLIQAVRLYKRKDSPEGVLGSAEWGGTVSLSRLDPDVMTLLSPLRIPAIG